MIAKVINGQHLRDAFEERVRVAYGRIMQIPTYAALVHGDITVNPVIRGGKIGDDVWVDNMVQMGTYVAATVPMLTGSRESLLRHPDPKYQRIARHFGVHARGETAHDIIAFRDIQRGGYDLKVAKATYQAPECVLEYIARSPLRSEDSNKAIATLAVATTLEGLSVLISPQWVENWPRKFDHPNIERMLDFAREHADEDATHKRKGHYEMGLDIMKDRRLEDYPLLLREMEMTATFFEQLGMALHQRNLMRKEYPTLYPTYSFSQVKPAL